MKKKKKALMVFIFTYILVITYTNDVSIGQESVYTSPKTTFEIGTNVTFSVYSTAPLIWNANQYENFTMYYNATGLPTGENITLVTISIYYNIPNDPHKKQARVLAPQFNLTEENQQYEVLTSFPPPSEADEFNLTIEIVASSTSFPENQLFEAEFPGDETYIEVKESLVLPIINLPGFPNIETFVRWIFIFLVALIIIALPAIFVASFKLKETIQSRSKKPKKEKRRNKKGEDKK